MAVAAAVEQVSEYGRRAVHSVWLRLLRWRRWWGRCRPQCRRLPQRRRIAAAKETFAQTERRQRHIRLQARHVRRLLVPAVALLLRVRHGAECAKLNRRRIRERAVHRLRWRCDRLLRCCCGCCCCCSVAAAVAAAAAAAAETIAVTDTVQT